MYQLLRRKCGKQHSFLGQLSKPRYKGGYPYLPLHRTIDKNCLAIIDELGRGTSTSDGLAIALSIAEALVDSKALIWFATHFRELGKFNITIRIFTHQLINIAQIMSERVGVVNIHLVVNVSEDNTMTTLYKIGQGFVKEQHYGLASARIVDLPPKVLEVAQEVSQTLDAQASAKKNSSKAFALAKRRKLVLSLQETLKQAESSPMDDRVLLNWLRKLQAEFVTRMEKLDSDATNDTEGSAEDEEKSSTSAVRQDIDPSDALL